MVNNMNQLYPADVIVAKKRNGIGRILNHYIVYVGDNTFIGNLKVGVEILSENKLSELFYEYEPIRINRFNGSESMRNNALNRAFSRIGQKYNLISFNCEHYANWVQKGRVRSQQVTFVFAILVLGIYKFNKLNNGKR